MTVYEVGDVVLVEPDGSEAEIVSVMMQDEGPAYWVTYVDSGRPAVVFSEEIVEV